jgi:glycosyltransferase 2 family protein
VVNSNKEKNRRLDVVWQVVLPWSVTIFALFYVLREINWADLGRHLRSADPFWLGVALAATSGSYLLRAWRWQHFFPTMLIRYADSVRVLFLGFFMNNVLPARAGEIVRAHLGARLTGQTRTLVLATILSERLTDGLTISIFFIFFATGLTGDPNIGFEMLLVAGAFGAATLGILILLAFREKLFGLVSRFQSRFDSKAALYTSDRVRVFINGLSPLCSSRKLPVIIGGCLIVWLVELTVYVAISNAFAATLSLSKCVLFLVAVNFSSLIPAAPGGLGVIEAVATGVLSSAGVDRELALTMVIMQHIIQYAVVGIPGIILTVTWKRRLQLQEEATA